VLLGDGFMATDAVAMGRGLMLSVLEAKVLTRQQCTLANVGRAVAAEAGVLVVRLRVAAAARRLARQVQRFDLTCRGDPLVTVDAIDPMRRVRAMLEGVRGVTRP
jgi:hypothetical protein